MLTISSKDITVFNELLRKLTEKCEIDGFLLHPKTFYTGYIYVPCKAGQLEAIPVMKDIREYDEIVNEGVVNYSSRKHKEFDLIPDLEKKIDESVEEIKEWAVMWERDIGISVYCSSLTIAPFGFIAYYRGLTECLKDVKKCREKVIDACFSIAEEIPDYVTKISNKIGIPRVWITFTYSTPDVLGGYFYEFSWKPAKTMIERLISRGITPILQFDVDPSPMFKELSELPERKCIIHLSASTDILKAKRELGDKFCIAGNIEFENLTKEEIEHLLKGILKEITKKEGQKGLIISTSGGSPIILSKNNIDSLREKLISAILTSSMLGGSLS